MKKLLSLKSRLWTLLKVYPSDNRICTKHLYGGWLEIPCGKCHASPFADSSITYSANDPLRLTALAAVMSGQAH